ncbi:hypothetical protein JCM11251_005686 [Rhodosporidiobolus azoricus]
MSTSPLVLLRHDLQASSSDSDQASPTPTRSSTFSDETGAVLFTAEHGRNYKTEEYETELLQDGKTVGAASLHYLAFGTGPSLEAEHFYKHPNCFSSKKRFKLSRDGIVVYWKTSKKDRSMKLVEHKTKRVLATVEPTSREPQMMDEGCAAAALSRLTIHHSLLTTNLHPKSSSDALPTLDRPPLLRFKSSTSSFSSAYTPSAVSTTPGSSAFATRASSPAPSENGKGQEATDVDGGKGKEQSTAIRSDLRFASSKNGTSRHAFSCPIPSFPTLASLLRQEETAQLVASGSPGEVGEKREMEVEYGGVDAVGVILLTLLHEDYVRAEKGRKQEEKEREERGMEWDAS